MAMGFNSDSSFASSQFRNSRVVSFTVSPLNPLKPRGISGIFLLVFLTAFILNICSSTTFTPIYSEALYDRHCGHVVSRSPLQTKSFSSIEIANSLGLKAAYFSAGDRTHGQTPHYVPDFQQHLSFWPFYAHETVSDGVYKVQSSLHLQSPTLYSLFNSSNRRRLRLVRFRGPRILPRSRSIVFSLRGYWSRSSGKLCMVGSGTSYMSSGHFRSLNVVLKLNYPKKATILTSLITGTLESSDGSRDFNYFAPISILAFSTSPDYEFSLLDKGAADGCLSGHDGGLSLSEGVCLVFGQQSFRFDLEYESDCGSANCNPLGKNVGYLPTYMTYQGSGCSDGSKVRMSLDFPNSTYYRKNVHFEPSSTLIAEGMWDHKENRLCAVACRILNFTDTLAYAFVGDCSVKLSFHVPAALSITRRNTVEGKFWSNKTVNETGYFSKIGLQSYQGWMIDQFNIKYNYTKIDTPRSCAKDNTAKLKGKTYPDADSHDMRFDMSVRNSRGQSARGFSSPFFVGDQLYNALVNYSLPGPKKSVQPKNSGMLSISYKIILAPTPGFRLGGEIISSQMAEISAEGTNSKMMEISAEGTYDRDTGVLCMRGCWQRKFGKNDSRDCEIEVKVQYPPLDAKGGVLLKGTIESKRLNSDPQYFEPLQLSSMSIYTTQAKESIWRMDFELTMVLVFNTLACVFVILQLFYVKKHPDVLSFISIAMLAVLTLGHMIPLLLNFEALFVGNRNQQTVFVGSGGWLAVNEVIVRVVTMVAFLLQLRLLQLTWSARQDNLNSNGLWDSEKKVIYMTLPLYITGVLVAWLVHQWNHSSQSSGRPVWQQNHNGYQFYNLHRRHSFWEDLKSYAGLVLDGFLLPQILFNLVSDSREKALSSFFYLGTTVVRLLPHAYDLYRAHNSSWYLDVSYIYASHKLDFYSTAWDIIIPIGGVLFALLIFLQQRSGGRCILPKRFRGVTQSSVYEKVPTISNEEL